MTMHLKVSGEPGMEVMTASPVQRPASRATGSVAGIAAMLAVVAAQRPAAAPGTTLTRREVCCTSSLRKRCALTRQMDCRLCRPGLPRLLCCWRHYLLCRLRSGCVLAPQCQRDWTAIWSTCCPWAKNEQGADELCRRARDAGVARKIAVFCYGW